MPNNSRRIAAKHTQLSGRSRKSKKKHSSSVPQPIKNESYIAQNSQEQQTEPQAELKEADQAVIEIRSEIEENPSKSMLLKEMRYIGVIAGAITIALIAFSISLT